MEIYENIQAHMYLNKSQSFPSFLKIEKKKEIYIKGAYTNVKLKAIPHIFNFNSKAYRFCTFLPVKSPYRLEMKTINLFFSLMLMLYYFPFFSHSFSLAFLLSFSVVLSAFHFTYYCFCYNDSQLSTMYIKSRTRGAKRDYCWNGFLVEVNKTHFLYFLKPLKSG